MFFFFSFLRHDYKSYLDVLIKLRPYPSLIQALSMKSGLQESNTITLLNIVVNIKIHYNKKCVNTVYFSAVNKTLLSTMT